MADGATTNELRHINSSLGGLHRKADKTNGSLGDHATRLAVLEAGQKTYVTTTDCAENRGSNWKRTASILIGAIIAAIMGLFSPVILAKITGG